MKRREFLKGGAGVAMAMLAEPAVSVIASPKVDPLKPHGKSNYPTFWYPFTGHPDADTCWSLSVGPDGRIYAAACAESVPGGVVEARRATTSSTDTLDYLFSLDEMVDDPGDSGRATQCKIHYSFAPSMADGVLYMATHLSGPPIDQPAYSPWLSWHDPKRCFRGSALLAFDTKNDKVLWWDTLIPKEGCRCLLHDEERHLLYALSYPRDHFIIYDTKTRTRRDLGRIGSINAQTLFLDRKHRVWTTDDYGHLVRYDPEKDRLERSPFVLPHNPQFQTGWHSVFYDVAAAPDGECVYRRHLDRPAAPDAHLAATKANGRGSRTWARRRRIATRLSRWTPLPTIAAGWCLPATASCITSRRAGAIRFTIPCREPSTSARASCGG